MGYLGTKPANAVLTSEQIGDGVITTADLANGAVSSAKLSTTLDLSNNSLTLPASLTTGLVKTGSLVIASGSGRGYLDIANCFTSAYNDYLIVFNLFNDATLSNTVGLMLAIETSGASLDGSNLLFSNGNFVSGHSHHMRYAQTGNGSVTGSQAESFDWAKLLGTGDNGNTICRFSGTVSLRNVYNSSIKTGNAHGIMQRSSDSYDEVTGFVSTNSYTGRGLRMWYGVNQTINGQIAVNSYGTIQVYGVAK
jgi:hypothetical protein